MNYIDFLSILGMILLIVIILGVLAATVFMYLRKYIGRKHVVTATVHEVRHTEVRMNYVFGLSTMGKSGFTPQMSTGFESVIFMLENGTLLTLKISVKDANMLIKGKRGKLTYRNGDFLKFTEMEG